MKVSSSQLKEVLSYCSSTGVFRWKMQRGRARAGDVAGHVVTNKDGYSCVQLRLFGVLYYAHRLAWLYHYGNWPVGVIDHINQDSTFNAIANLRDTTQAMNAKNMHMKKRNTSGVTGVYWEERTNSWRAEVKVNNVKTRLGRFADIREAGDAVMAFRKCMGFTDRHGAVKRLQEA